LERACFCVAGAETADFAAAAMRATFLVAANFEAEPDEFGFAVGDGVDVGSERYFVGAASGLFAR